MASGTPTRQSWHANTRRSTSSATRSGTSLAVTDRYLRDVAPMHVIDTIRARR
jgi:hypothetical protein